MFSLVSSQPKTLLKSIPGFCTRIRLKIEQRYHSPIISKWDNYQTQLNMSHARVNGNKKNVLRQFFQVRTPIPV